MDSPPNKRSRKQRQMINASRSFSTRKRRGDDIAKERSEIPDAAVSSTTNYCVDISRSSSSSHIQSSNRQLVVRLQRITVIPEMQIEISRRLDMKVLPMQQREGGSENPVDLISSGLTTFSLLSKRSRANNNRQNDAEFIGEDERGKRGIQPPTRAASGHQSTSTMPATSSIPPTHAQNRRRRHAEVPHRITYRKAVTLRTDELELLCNMSHKCGPLTELCQHCGALFFTRERVSRDNEYTNCCNKGAYTLPALGTCPSALRDLYTGDCPLNTQFRVNIKYINRLFAMASFKTSRPIRERRGQGHWSFTVCGQIYHFLDPIPNERDLAKPRLNQIYFLDVDEALKRRNSFANGRIHPDLIMTIETILRSHNKYVQAYKSVGDELIERMARNMDVENIIIGITKEPVIKILAARQNPNWIPGQSDMAAIFEGSEPPIKLDLVLYPRNDPNHRHHELKLLNPLTDPMVYPLLFPCGDDGFSIGIRYNTRRGKPVDKTVTILQFYRYRLYVRDNFSTIHHGGTLFQQYIVDGWIKHEMTRLWWFRQHQNYFRRTSEETLRRYNRNRLHGLVGRAVILPSGFPGGERYRRRQYLDSMNVVARFGKPDLFITFTCNPNWPEIKNNLMVHQKWENRPDIVCRVFQIKLLDFMQDIIHKQLYGVVVSHQYVVEFQKRGLPHAHIIITFHEDDKLRDVMLLDRIISARIPDRQTQPLLYQRVRDFQLHAPCGRLNPNAPCLLNGKCTKRYPKSYREETAFAVGQNNRPEYKRPADGRKIFVEEWNRSIDNRRVVPYNDYALAKYNCHINFEIVGTKYTIKYLHKYINKGPDSFTLHEDKANLINQGDAAARGQPQQWRIDEVQDYIDGRYVSAMEATWRTFQFKMHNRSHSVLVLPVHLPNEREIIYNEEDDVEEVERRLQKPSKLEAWFVLNQLDSNARLYRYVEIPEHYTWDDKNANWNRRSQVSKQLGCLMQVSPSEDQNDKFFLRVLLKRMKGATSYDYLLTLEDGHKCETFREACYSRNWLIEEGGEFECSLKEVESNHHPRKLRKLFALICCVTMDEDISRIPQLWQTFKKSLISDFRNTGMNRRDAFLTCLTDIENIVSRCRPGLSLDGMRIEYGQLVDYDDQTDDQTNDLDGKERRWLNGNGDIPSIPQEEYSVSSLNKDQKIVFLRVLNACARKSGFLIPVQVYDDLGDVMTEQMTQQKGENIFYLDGPGGTGKTYLYNTLITVLNEILHKKTIAVAWVGTAASILIGGMTVHKAFKLPLTLSEETFCGWNMQSAQSEFIRDQVALIVWDEASMTPRFAVEAVNRYLMYIMRQAEPMGGKVVLFGGDFRQILPIVLGASRNDIIARSLGASPLWPYFTKLQLTENMRVALHPEMAGVYDDLGNCTFAHWLLKMGEGILPYISLNKKIAPVAPDDLIEIPARFQVITMVELIDFVYQGNYTRRENVSRAILCSTNAVVNTINDIIVRQIENGEARTYFSEDALIGSDDDTFLAPLDLLNSIDSPSLPPHELVLKCGAIVMLLRNLDVNQGQCNGSRMRVICLGDHIIECEILTGQRIGEKLLLPRIKIKAEDAMLPREIVRLQFPIRLAYGMTINKSQGQTLNRVGICLKRPCFTHGQLYVAFSRVGHIDRVKIFIEDSGKQGTFKYRGRKRFTSNIVFGSVLETSGDDINLERQEIMDVPPTLSESDDEYDYAESQQPTFDPPPPSTSAISSHGCDSDPDYRSDESDSFETATNNIRENVELNDMDLDNDEDF